MRLTGHTDYALRLLMYLGRQQGRLVTVQEIAKAHGISEHHLRKVAHRLGQAGPAAQEIAEIAAAVGRDVTLDLLAVAADLDTDGVVAAVDELWRRRILREHGDGGESYDFSHDLLRDAAYALASPPRRWLLHRRLAQGLELLHAGHLDDVASQLADQYDRGGRTDRAVHYRARSAALAESVFANAEALRQHQRILELIATQPEGKDRDAKELDALQAMVPSLTAVRGYSAPEVLEALERAAALAERLDRRPTLLAAYVGLNSVLYVRGQIARAMDLVRNAGATNIGIVLETVQVQ